MFAATVAITAAVLVALDALRQTRKFCSLSFRSVHVTCTCSSIVPSVASTPVGIGGGPATVVTFVTTE